MDGLLNLIGANDGARKGFDEWVQEARTAGLQPNQIQKMKRLNLAHTVLDENGKNWIVRGAKPA